MNKTNKNVLTLLPGLGLMLFVLVMFAATINIITNQPVHAEHTHAHCEELYPEQDFDNPRYEACVDNLGTLNDDATTEFIEGPTLEQLKQEELKVANENTIANVKNNPIYDLLLTFINFLTAGVGLVVTTMVVVGGLEYMSAGGNPQKTQQAITRITNALIGLVLYIFMYAILQWLIPGGLFG